MKGSFLAFLALLALLAAPTAGCGGSRPCSGDSGCACDPEVVPDADRDGYNALEDCDEGLASVNPGAVEIPCDGIDQDCDGPGDDTPDADGDGADACAPHEGGDAEAEDCDDTDPAVRPGAEELANAVDDDCDGSVLVGAGAFLMGKEGSLWEFLPVHEVDTPAFEMDTFEVTNADFIVFLAEQGNLSAEGMERYDLDDAEGDGRIFEEGGAWAVEPGWERHPVVEVSWFGARDYCAWRGARLPSEAEWEKTARGGCEARGDVTCDPEDDMPEWPWGDESFGADSGELANSNGRRGTTEEVGSHPAGVSVYGAQDLAGNVWEWVEDCWHPSYDGAPTDGSAWTADCVGEADPGDPETLQRIRRGGGYNLTLDVSTVYVRFFTSAYTSNQDAGFRCASDL